MSLINVKIDHKTFKLECDTGTEQKLCELAEKINQQLLNIKQQSPNATLELLLLMTALNLQDQVYNLEQKIALQGNDCNTQNNENEKLAETLSTIAGYLEGLATKISK